MSYFTIKVTRQKKKIPYLAWEERKTESCQFQFQHKRKFFIRRESTKIGLWRETLGLLKMVPSVHSTGQRHLFCTWKTRKFPHHNVSSKMDWIFSAHVRVVTWKFCFAFLLVLQCCYRSSHSMRRITLSWHNRRPSCPVLVTDACASLSSGAEAATKTYRLTNLFQGKQAQLKTHEDECTWGVTRSHPWTQHFQVQNVQTAETCTCHVFDIHV